MRMRTAKSDSPRQNPPQRHSQNLHDVDNPKVPFSISRKRACIIAISTNGDAPSVSRSVSHHQLVRFVFAPSSMCNRLRPSLVLQLDLVSNYKLEEELGVQSVLALSTNNASTGASKSSLTTCRALRNSTNLNKSLLRQKKF